MADFMSQLLVLLFQSLVPLDQAMEFASQKRNTCIALPHHLFLVKKGDLSVWWH
jgi:hypothetical protein